MVGKIVSALLYLLGKYINVVFARKASPSDARERDNATGFPASTRCIYFARQ